MLTVDYSPNYYFNSPTSMFKLATAEFKQNTCFNPQHV